MPLTKTQADGINLGDTFAFTGTVSGAGGGVTTSTAVTKGSASINVLSGLNKVWWHIDSNNNPTIDESFNVSSATDATGYTSVTFTNTMANNKWTCVLCSEKRDVVNSIFGSFETTTECYYRSYDVVATSNSDPSDVSGILTGDLA